MSTHNKKGFTLVELLVVISIISLLSSLILAAVVSAKEKAKISGFVQNLQQFQIALENYKSSTGAYPGEGEWGIYGYNGWTGGQYYLSCAGTGPSGNSFWVPPSVQPVDYSDWNSPTTCPTASIYAGLNTMQIQTSQTFPYTTYVNQPAFFPKYLSTAPTPPGNSGNMLVYQSVPLPDSITQMEIDYGNPSGGIAFSCGNKKIQGYLIYFWDNDNYIRGTPSNYTLPHITIANPANYNADPATLPYTYCLTAP